MRPNCCHISLAFILKLLNYLQTFVGVSIIIYSVWMLNQWNHHIPVAPPSAPSPDSSPSVFLPSQVVGVSHQINPLGFAMNNMVSGLDDEFALNSFKLPAPWFIYFFMGVGILLCFISFIGCIAAEAINGCCLCIYTLLKTVFILLEATLVAFIAFDHHWEQDLPSDPTGDLESLKSFIEENVDICKWVGITVVVIQALSVLLGIILRTMVSSHRSNFDNEDDYENTRGRTWEPLLNPHSSQTFGSAKGDVRGTHSDIWSSRIREKYGLGSGDKYNSPNQNSTVS